MPPSRRMERFDELPVIDRTITVRIHRLPQCIHFQRCHYHIQAAQDALKLGPLQKPAAVAVHGVEGLVDVREANAKARAVALNDAQQLMVHALDCASENILFAYVRRRGKWRRRGRALVTVLKLCRGRQPGRNSRLSRSGRSNRRRRPCRCRPTVRVSTPLPFAAPPAASAELKGRPAGCVCIRGAGSSWGARCNACTASPSTRRRPRTGRCSLRP